MAVLNGWKEIARYLNRGVRTVQRWKFYGLPIHCPAGKSPNAIIALTEELDAWVNATPLLQHPSEISRMKQRIHELEAEVESLREGPHKRGLRAAELITTKAA